MDEKKYALAYKNPRKNTVKPPIPKPEEPKKKRPKAPKSIPVPFVMDHQPAFVVNDDTE